MHKHGNGPGNDNIRLGAGSDVPAHWPEHVKYINEPLYSDKVTPETKGALHRPSPSTAAWPKIGYQDAKTVINPAIEIRRIIDPTHPARGQHGLFATRHLAPSAFVIAYLGIVHTNADDDTDPDSDYDLALDRELGLSIDAARVGNEARFINDYRGCVRAGFGVDEGPNVELRDCWAQMSESRKWERRIGVFVLGAGKAGKRNRGIRAGQEILLNYGRSFWKERKRAENV